MLTLCETLIRLERLANDCDQRSALSIDGHARNLYHVTATGCRRAMTARDSRQHETLLAMTVQARIARWYDGEDAYGEAPQPARGPLGRNSALSGPRGIDPAVAPAGESPGAITGIQRIYLRGDGSGKADLPPLWHGVILNPEMEVIP